jgi:uncharacterized membrane protein
MEEKNNLLRSLLDVATDYGETSIELVRLKVLDKTTDLVSSLVPFSIVIILLVSFLLFVNLGIAFWLGEILGKTFYGFLVVAVFYLIAAIFIRIFLYKWIKRLVGDYMVKRLLKK